MRSLWIFLLIIFQNHGILSQENERFILNPETPKYTEKEWLTFEKKYSIDVLDYEEYEITLVTTMTADEKGNLFIVSLVDNEIFVFDTLGNFLKKYGGRGQGPRELEKPFTLAVKNNKMYVHEMHKGLKIWDSDGEYLDFIFFPPSKREPYYYPYPDYYLIPYHEWDEDPLKTGKYILHYYFSIFDLELKKISNINEIVIDAHKVYGFLPSEIIAIDSGDNIYTPVSHDIYKINKYSKDGKFLFSFGREYKRKGYSKRTRDRYYDRYTKKFKKSKPIAYMLPLVIPDFPPVVRHLMVDGRNNIWVVSGEWYRDNRCEYKIKSTIDIFSNDGEFLYTFETDKITPQSFIKNNLLYCHPRGLFFESEEEDSKLNVYNITYKRRP